VNTGWHVLVIILRLCLDITGRSAVEDELKSRYERRRGDAGVDDGGGDGGRFITAV